MPKLLVMPGPDGVRASLTCFIPQAVWSALSAGVMTIDVTGYVGFNDRLGTSVVLLHIRTQIKQNNHNKIKNKRTKKPKKKKNKKQKKTKQQ